MNAGENPVHETRSKSEVLRAELLRIKRQKLTESGADATQNLIEPTEAEATATTRKMEILKAKLAESKIAKSAPVAMSPALQTVTNVVSPLSPIDNIKSSAIRTLAQHRAGVGSFARTQGLTRHYRAANTWTERVRTGFKVEPLEDDSRSHTPIYWRPARTTKRVETLIATQKEERNTHIRHSKRKRTPESVHAFSDVVRGGDSDVT